MSDQPSDGSQPLSVTEFAIPSMFSVQGPDPAGGLIVSTASGGEYRVDAQGVSRWLSSGLLLGLSESTLVVSECGDTLADCHIDVVDRGTGERHRVPSPAGSPGVFEPPLAYAGTMLDNLSPTGEYIAVTSTPRAVRVLGLLSLETGEFVALGQPAEDSKVAWSWDGRLAFYEGNGRVMVYDTIDGTTIVASPHDAYVLSFTTRAT